MSRSRPHPIRPHVVFVMTLLAGLTAATVATPSSAAIVSASADTSIQGLPPDAHGQTITVDRHAPGGQTMEAAHATAASGGSAGTDGSFDSVASASAAVGSLHAGADTRGFTREVAPVSDAGGHASASWADTFRVDAKGHEAGELGAYHGQVVVEGSLADSIRFRSYAQSTSVGSLRIDPGTGFNGGRVVLDHVADLALGYDTGLRETGEQTFFFDFTFPFTFGANVTVSAALDVFTFIRSLGGGDQFSEARSVADYGNTMRWLGGEAFDAAGDLLTDWSAISATSGFDYRFAAPDAVVPGVVPEPEPIFLFGAAFVALQVVRRTRRSFGTSTVR